MSGRSSLQSLLPFLQKKEDINNDFVVLRQWTDLYGQQMCPIKKHLPANGDAFCEQFTLMSSLWIIHKVLNYFLENNLI